MSAERSLTVKDLFEFIMDENTKSLSLDPKVQWRLYVGSLRIVAFLYNFATPFVGITIFLSKHENSAQSVVALISWRCFADEEELGFIFSLKS